MHRVLVIVNNLSLRDAHLEYTQHLFPLSTCNKNDSQHRRCTKDIPVATEFVFGCTTNYKDQSLIIKSHKECFDAILLEYTESGKR